VKALKGKYEALFKGRIKSELQCLTCSAIIEDIQYLPYPGLIADPQQYIQKQKMYNLFRGVKGMWKCESCNTEQEHTNITTLETPPDLLTIKLEFWEEELHEIFPPQELHSEITFKTLSTKINSIDPASVITFNSTVGILLLLKSSIIATFDFIGLIPSCFSIELAKS